MKSGAKKYPSTLVLIMLISLIFGLMVVYVWQHLTVDAMAKEIQNLEQEKQTLANTNEQLRAEGSNLTSYGRIKKIATEELGLVFPGENPELLVVRYKKEILDEDRIIQKETPDTTKTEQLASENQ